MNTTSLNLDRDLLESFRCHYEQDGYQFILEPAKVLLPDFLQEFDLDAIAISSGGGVVIEVKRYKQSREKSRKLLEISRAVEAHPGWKLDIVYSTPFHPLGGWLLPTVAEIQADLTAARIQIANLEGGRHSVGDAAVQLLLLWPKFEAAARRRLIDDKVDLGRKTLNSKSLIEVLVDQGLLSDEDEGKVVDLMLLRDFASAGFREPAVSTGHLKLLADITEKLMAAKQRTAA